MPPNSLRTCRADVETKNSRAKSYKGLGMEKLQISPLTLSSTSTPIGIWVLQPETPVSACRLIQPPLDFHSTDSDICIPWYTIAQKRYKKRWHRILSKGNQITALETTNLVDLTEGNCVGVTDIEGHQVLWLLVTYLYPDSISLSAGKPKKNGGPPGSVRDSENKRSVRESQGIPQGCLEISDLILFCGCFPPACFGC